MGSHIFAFAFLIFFYNGVDSENLKIRSYHLDVGIPRADVMLKSELLSRIVGGSLVSQSSSLPFQAGIVVTLTTGMTSVCGGSLVSNTKVLTAAHCWWDGQSQARQFTIVLGSLTIFSGGTRKDTTNVLVHSNWNTNDITHDIAMATITKVDYSSNIQNIPLPTQQDVNRDFSGLTGTVSGYGKTSDGQASFPASTALHQLSVSVITNAVCQRSFEITLHNSHMCTDGKGGVGSCDGDSGGPLTVVWNNKRTLVGIVSFGLGDRCQSGYPSVYTRVTAFLTWIQSNL